MTHDDIRALSDEEAIAMAMLMGGSFTYAKHDGWEGKYYKDWTCWDDAEGCEPWSETHAETKGEAARFFLRRHLLPKVTA